MSKDTTSENLRAELKSPADTLGRGAELFCR